MGFFQGLFNRKLDNPITNDYLKSENNSLKLNIMKLEDQLRQLQQIANAYKNERDELAGRVKKLCTMVLDNEYAVQQLGGANTLISMNAIQTIDYTINNLNKQRLEQAKMLATLRNTIEEQRRENAQLKDQIAQLLIKVKERNMTPEQTTEVSESNEQAIQKSLQNQSKGASISQNVAEDRNEFNTTTNTSDLLVVGGGKPPVPTNPISVELIDDVVKNMTEPMWDILEAIGVKGYSQTKDIQQYLRVTKDYTATVINNALSGVKSANLLIEDKITNGAYRWFYTYELSEKGEEIFRYHFGKRPVVCEKQRLRAENTTPEHGYLILDTAHILEKQYGYKEVTMDRKECTIVLPNGKIYIPDIIATLPDGTKHYFEVDLGHHTQEDWNDKMDKMHQVTSLMHIVTDVKSTMNNQLSKQITMWTIYRGKDSLKGTRIRLTTIDRLSKGKADGHNNETSKSGWEHDFIF